MVCANVVFALALSRYVPFVSALGASSLIYFVTLRRFIAQMRDQPRARWITVWFDQPLFVHFGASTFALLFSPVAALLAFTLLALPSAAGRGVFADFRLFEVYAYGLGVLLSVWAIWIERHFVRIRRMDVAIADLPPEFDGYRIAQLSDLHVGSFDPKSRALEWVALSNALDPDLVAVTGDLVTSGRGFYRDVAEALGALRGKDGVFVSMGNHDLWNNDELTHLVAEHGPTVLRDASQIIRRGDAMLNVAGIDGRIATPAGVADTLRRCTPGAPIVVLAHYPWVFGAAASAGADLILTGHTHGGQLGVPFLGQRLNLARLTGQRSRGLVYTGKTAMYVNAGLGTTGPPMRLAVPPEIALITLRRAS
ncbi:MAG TPA: metallophosphoesterase [Polyangiaceae bacterium]|nr:metallophosphoesterase [Polyangiaceae bacterium]